MQQALLEECGEARGNALFQRYQQAFPVAYRDDFKPRVAVHDILRLESVGADQPLVMHLYRAPEAPERLLRFKLFGREHIALSAVLPMLEKLGLRVLQARPYEIAAGADTLWILDFDMAEDQGVAVDVVQVKENFQAAFARIWSGAMESDGFNRLVLGAGLNWREVVMLRAYGKYLLQARAPFSQAYMEQTLGKHPAIASYLAELFQARFDPRSQRDQGRRTTVLGVAIEEALEQVSSLDEDRILRRFWNLIQATLRTNFFQTDPQGEPKEYLAFKFDPAQIEDLPKPRPRFEIFVYSPRVEAVHLRGGPVARGGLRWSNRKEDFRTEVLGLMKAQMVKNTVIHLLKAPVDLLWNGGIGAYVKATMETQTEVGDKANDALRVDGRELRCKVVGEGGNLGFTQRGRIEYALAGGRILTDAIDNSGGVNCSDHEVNMRPCDNEVWMWLPCRNAGGKEPTIQSYWLKRCNRLSPYYMYPP